MKKFFALTILIFAMMSGVCLALDKDDFSLGGVYLDMSEEEVIKMHGQPTFTFGGRFGGLGHIISSCVQYGDNVEIAYGVGGVRFVDVTRFVVVTANNGWKTTAGVHVGMSIDDVIKIYGKDYRIYKRKPFNHPDYDNKRKHLHCTLDGTAYVWSRVGEKYIYDPGDITHHINVIVKNKKVTAIEISQSTPEY